MKQVWGISSSIDVYQCNKKKITSKQDIQDFVIKLCRLIEMRRFGQTTIVHFGVDERVAGYSMIQLIETSLISAHFANQSNTVYLDVFSCKPYDVKKAAQFTKEFFGGKTVKVKTTERI